MFSELTGGKNRCLGKLVSRNLLQHVRPVLRCNGDIICQLSRSLDHEQISMGLNISTPPSSEFSLLYSTS
ncbi:hypothetical protein PAXRUDRAFT_203779 [Paxillus rubicundulus Ve08.2h10]|uniref:Uncharacterized protein n=1 Tax=Paxillus rubicundulus Ve08.2h10 TaxID=930991 RepID=A0A0D0DPV4_9AGAM|nr:hypothetical protein PAXRUDRAFT_203779 [Paxillus rubicundulus Ve08.2h10]